MNTNEAIEFARSIKAKGPLAADAPKSLRALIALLDHSDDLQIPDMETAIRMVAAHIHERGRFYIEIAVDPETKLVGWTFEPTEREQSKEN